MNDATPPGNRIRVGEDDVEARVEIAAPPFGPEVAFFSFMPAAVFGVQALFVTSLALPALVRAVLSAPAAQALRSGHLAELGALCVAIVIGLLQWNRIRQRETLSIGPTRVTLHRKRAFASLRRSLGTDEIGWIGLGRPRPLDELFLARARPGALALDRDAPLGVLRIIAGTESIDVGITLTEPELRWLADWTRERVAHWAERDERSQAPDETPPGRRITVTEGTPDVTVFRIGSRGLKRTDLRETALALVFGALWLGFVPWDQVGPGLRRGEVFWLGSLGIGVIPIAAWFGAFANRAWTAERIDVSASELTLRVRRPFFPSRKRLRIQDVTVVGSSGELERPSPEASRAGRSRGRRDGREGMTPAIRLGKRSVPLGTTLTEGEMRWLVSALARAVDQQRAAGGNPGPAEGEAR